MPPKAKRSKPTPGKTDLKLSEKLVEDNAELENDPSSLNNISEMDADPEIQDEPLPKEHIVNDSWIPVDEVEEPEMEEPENSVIEEESMLGDNESLEVNIANKNSIQPPQDEGDEHYGANKFAIDRNQDEIYAVTKEGNQFFLKDPITGNPVYARKRTASGEMKPYPPKTSDGKPIVAILNDGTSMYPLGSNGDVDMDDEDNKYWFDPTKDMEVYPKKQGEKDEHYLFNNEGEPIFAKNKLGDDYYASRYNENNEIEEFIPQGKKDGKFFFIKKNEKLVYPFNKIRNIPIYDYNSTHSFYLNTNGIEYYGKNQNEREIYGKSNNKEMYAYDSKTMNEILARDENGNEYYAKDENGNEYYPMNNTTNEQFCAKDKNNIMFYAKNTQGDEFYPRKLVKREIPQL